MKRIGRLILYFALAIVVALGLGWVWGASGRADLDRRVKHTELQLEVSEARARVLQARVDLYNVNFGDASRNLETAKIPLQGAIARLQQLGEEERTRKGNEALARIEEAQRMAAKMDQGANTRAAAALRALDDIIEQRPR